MDSYELYIYDVDEILADVLYVPATGSTIIKSPALYTAPTFSSVAIKMKLIDTVLK